MLLKLINLNNLNYSSIDTLCFFINIYYILLLHIKLILNPISLKDWCLLYETVSYEIGNDIFSLSELEHCIICGKLERPSTLPRGFYNLPPINDYHYMYSINIAECRLRFLINYNNIINHKVIYIVTPTNIYEILNNLSFEIFNKYLNVNSKNRVIILPKMIDIYKNDFGGNPNEILRHILRYLDKENWANVSSLISSGSKLPVIKYIEIKDTMGNDNRMKLIQ